MSADPLDTDPRRSLVNAFPDELRSDVEIVVELVPAARLAPARPFTVWVNGKQVHIPYRLYYDEPPTHAIGGLSPIRQRILHCLYTRHHDGLVRQRHLERVIESAEPWVVPYVVQLVGEYVVEIQLVIRRGLADVDVPGTAQHDAYGRFIAANPAFYRLTQQRGASYWDCYYRGRYPDQRRYPGNTILASLRAASRPYSRTAWARR